MVGAADTMRHDGRGSGGSDCGRCGAWRARCGGCLSARCGVCAGWDNAVRACANGRLIYVFTGEVTLRSPVGYKASPTDLTWGMSSPGDGA